MDDEKYNLPVLDTLNRSITNIVDNSLALFKTLLLPSIIICLLIIGRNLLSQHGAALRNEGGNLGVIASYMLISHVGISILVGILSPPKTISGFRVTLSRVNLGYIFHDVN